MQQQQQRHVSKPPRTQSMAERVIAFVNLLFGIPLVAVLVAAFLREPVPRDSAGLIFGALVFLFVFGLNAVGVCLLLRQRTLARLFQWLTAVEAALYLAVVIFILVTQGLSAVPLVVLLPAAFVALALIAMATLLHRFGED